MDLSGSDLDSVTRTILAEAGENATPASMAAVASVVRNRLAAGDADATTRLIVEALQIAGRLGVVLHGVGGLAHGSLPEGIIAVGDCAHTKLFPRMGAVVHHGGAGTTATASRAGVPQVVVSHLKEQYGSGRQTRRLGNGARPIPRSKLTARPGWRGHPSSGHRRGAHARS